jgi:membrane-bound lytic murein transglycosylase C
MDRLRGALSVLVLGWPLMVAGQDAGPEAGFSADPGFAEFRKERLGGFESYKEQVAREFREFAKLHAQVEEDYRQRISDVWAVPEESSRTRWVLYEDEYRVRKVVDFERKQIIWSTPAGQADTGNFGKQGARQMLEQLMSITRRAAFEKDEVAREVEAQSRSRFDHLETGSLDDSSPVLPAYLFGDSAPASERVRQAIDAMLASARRETREQAGQEVVSWVFPLTSGEKAVADNDQQSEEQPASKPAAPEVAGPALQARTIDAEQRARLPARARPFVEAINRENSEFELSAELLLAIMETESAFNPMARSPIPAFGLMQIVPASAGQDATAKLFGKPRLLAPSYLYNAENNIRVGAAYFNILYYRYFKGIEDPLSRLYCAIAAYNTGPGNVSLALTGSGMKLRPAIRIANTMTPDQVYQHLLRELPYEETINYLRKVTSRLDNYQALLAEG